MSVEQGLRRIPDQNIGQSLEQQIALRKQKLLWLESNGIDSFPAEPPLRTGTNAFIRQHAEEFIQNGDPVHILGRITAIRIHGSTIFADVDDGSEKPTKKTVAKTKGVATQKVIKGMQMMIGKQTDPNLIDLFINGIDPGDIIRVSGPLIKTKTGEITVVVSDFGMLAKALRPPPPATIDGELVDPDHDIRRRDRHLELMSSPEARERFRIRSQIVEIMRRKFIELGNLEVETPILDTTYGGANAKPFITHQRALDQDMFLRISNELYLKRLIVGMLGAGAGGVFEFSRDFRNEGMDRSHHPEFTQVELYMPYKDYNFMMSLTEELYREIALTTVGNLVVPFGDLTINFDNWRKVRVYDGLRQAFNIDPRTISDNDLRNLASNYNINPQQSRGFLLLELFENVVIPNLGPDPIIAYDYPKETSPLTKTHRQEKDLVERFELHIAGIECANCYSELNDPRDQRARFEEEIKRKATGDEETQPDDENFIVAMEYGLPPMGGIGFSIDRPTMFFTNTADIRDVILYPHVPPRNMH